ncbi:DUF7542 family protein [Halobaculum gomorrense]|uniref:Uncharacterized protein n=1 Tax=Halobaculum gomorrense TaxID=43928 RepID=A0A1M5NSG0_9EURY|nr:hypothetical protein [Halobaculum gomorrense]SHG92506.1 hypothetical protein SAMN05443636_1332 [Halobaculum gomorrense]
MPTAVLVHCEDCSYEETFDSLRAARMAVDDHERATAHGLDWYIGGLSGGVERAAADAGVCGREGCANPDSPLLDREAARSTGGSSTK